jgi:hypothetical protein
MYEAGIMKHIENCRIIRGRDERVRKITGWRDFN